MLCGSRRGSEISATFFKLVARAAGHRRRAAARSRASFSVGCLPAIVAANKGQFSSIISSPRNSKITRLCQSRPEINRCPALYEDCHDRLMVSINGSRGSFVTAIFFHSISPGLASGSSFIKCGALLFLLGNGNRLRPERPFRPFGITLWQPQRVENPCI